MTFNLTAIQSALARHNTHFPAQYVVPCFFGNPKLQDAMVNNGTASLIKVNSTKYVVTNKHVIDSFKKRREENPGIDFYIGNNIIDLEKSLVAESLEHDLCLININHLSHTSLEPNPSIKKDFFDARNIPNKPIEKDDYIIFAGYPGAYRNRISNNRINFGLFCHGGSEVLDSDENRIIASIEKNGCVILTDNGGTTTEHYGGMSGGAAFIEETLPSGIHVIRLAGFIYQDAGGFEAIYIKPSSFLFSELLKQQA